jgi:hypothetical protein
MTQYVPPKKNDANGYVFYTALSSRTADGTFLTNPTLASGDVKVSIDGGAYNNLGTLPAVTPASGTSVKVTLAQAEINGDNINVLFIDAAGAEWCSKHFNFQTVTRQIDDLAYPTTSGRSMDVDASGGVEVGSFQANAITAAAIASDAITAAKIADGAIDAATFAAGAINAAAIADNAIDAGAIASDAITAAKIATGAITAAKFAAGAIDAAAIANGAIDAATFAAGAIDAAALAADAGTEIGTAVWATGTRVLTANTNLNDPSAAAIADAVWDEDATGHQTQGTFGQAIGDPAADANTIYGAVVTGAAGATVAADIIAIKAETVTILADTNELQTDWVDGGRLDLILDARASQASVNTIDGIVDDILLDTAEIGAAGAGLTAINLPNQTMDIIGNITGNLSGSVGSVTGAVGSVTGNVGGTINGLTATALKDFFDTDSATTYASAVAGSVVKEIADNAGGASLTVQDIVDGVWDEAQAGHVGAGSFGLYLDTEVSGVGGGTPPTAAAIADAVWDEAQADHVGAGSFGLIASEIADILVDTGTTLQGELDGIQADTEDIQSRLPAALVSGRIDASVGAMAANVMTAAAAAADLTTELQTGLATSAAVATLQTSVDDLPTNAELTTALGNADDAILAILGTPIDTDLATDISNIAAGSGPTVEEIGDELETRTIPANVVKVNNVTVDGLGTEADPWGPV